MVCPFWAQLFLIYGGMIMNKKCCNELVELIPLVKALDAEGVSKDMAVYTLLK